MKKRSAPFYFAYSIDIGHSCLSNGHQSKVRFIGGMLVREHGERETRELRWWCRSGPSDGKREGRAGGRWIEVWDHSPLSGPFQQGWQGLLQLKSSEPWTTAYFRGGFRHWQRAIVANGLLTVTVGISDAAASVTVNYGSQSRRVERCLFMVAVLWFCSCGPMNN